jgi:lipopolysaccharide transport system ATP-binding protein
VAALAARFDGVWKSYPRWLSGRRSLRSLASPRMRATGRQSGTRWALRDVSFDLHDGEALGLIGENGAGKSTLLRLTSGLGHLTRGRISVASNVASVLSLGATMNLDLTGRENALTATLLAGVRMREARRIVDAALVFAELEEFADSPVRSYSDGMKLRLAFGVVAQLEPGLLLLDEVIAVGDLRFKEKCMARIDELQATGTSLLFASHDLDQVAEQCDRALWLDGGVVRHAGDAEEVVEAYRESMHTETFIRTPVESDADGTVERSGGLQLRENRFGSQELTIERVELRGSLVGGVVEPDGSLSIDFTLRSQGRSIQRAVVSVAIFRVEGDVLCCQASSDEDDVVVRDVDGELQVSFRWDGIELLPGRYVVDIGAYRPEWEYAYDFHWHVYPLQVRGENGPGAIFRQRRRRWVIGASGDGALGAGAGPNPE